MQNLGMDTVFEDELDGDGDGSTARRTFEKVPIPNGVAVSNREVPSASAGPFKPKYSKHLTKA